MSYDFHTREKHLPRPCKTAKALLSSQAVQTQGQATLAGRAQAWLRGRHWALQIPGLLWGSHGERGAGQLERNQHLQAQGS